MYLLATITSAVGFSRLSLNKQEVQNIEADIMAKSDTSGKLKNMLL